VAPLWAPGPLLTRYRAAQSPEGAQTRLLTRSDALPPHRARNAGAWDSVLAARSRPCFVSFSSTRLRRAGARSSVPLRGAQRRAAGGCAEARPRLAEEASGGAPAQLGRRPAGLHTGEKEFSRSVERRVVDPPVLGWRLSGRAGIGQLQNRRAISSGITLAVSQVVPPAGQRVPARLPPFESRKEPCSEQTGHSTTLWRRCDRSPIEQNTRSGLKRGEVVGRALFFTRLWV